MAEWFVGPVMDKLINAFSDYLQDRYFGGRTGMKEMLERLRVNQPLIQAVVSAYTQGNITDRNLKSWLWLLRDAIDEADDVLDDLEYLKHKEQLELNMEETKVRSSFDRLFLGPARKLGKVCERPFIIYPNLERLEEAVQKLDRVSAQVNTFLHLVEKKEKEQQVKDQQLCDDRASGSFPGPVFIGRDQEKEIVMQWLRKPSNHNLSLLSIVGHGGTGKTTLLQNIYADEIAKEFGLKIWVCVSNGFEVEEVITDMLKYLGEWSSDLRKLAPLQEKLNSVTRSKKFLLVLDDIWEENTTKWEKVFSPLANGNLGSKILVTTRIHAAASMIPDMIIENKETLILKGLEEAHCLELLKTHAFAGMENFREHNKLMCIAEEIVKKLSGSPLATKVIGGVLKYDLTPEHWESVLRSNIGSVELVPGQNTNTIMPILRLSFTFLQQPLQNCFAFCGIFPQDHKFDKDDLVRMWIALGFIQESSIEGETLEDIGRRYFDVLVRKSFFDDFQYYYKMHDSLNDLAQSISAEECFRFVGDNVLSFKVPKNVRHLFVKTENLEVFRMIKDVKNLHSVFLTCTTDDQDFIEIVTEILKASRRIRLLFIQSPWQKKMSWAIKNLRHLRYLNLHVGFTQKLRSLGSLYHLRFLICKKMVTGSCSGEFLAGGVSNLSNLRHLELPGHASVRGIEKLSSLQELNEFNIKNKNGYRIGELEHMNELRRLKIHFLENVLDAGEAGNAKLLEKKKLTDLFLNWGYIVNSLWESNSRIESRREIVNSDLDVNVLENLEPYKNLKRLFIVSYKGARSAKWMYNGDLISNLEKIWLDECSEWETLPPFGQLPHLKSLYLRNMPKAKRFDYKFHGNDKVSVFPSLEVLSMKGLQLLEDWFDAAGGAAEDDCFFPCLTKLFIERCSNLQELPYLPPKLKNMHIESVGWKAHLNCKQGSKNCCGISKSIPLESLEVHSCPNITSLLQADVRLEALTNLRIGGCPNLISLGGLLQVESAIEKSLRVLSFRDLQSLQSLPSSLERLSSLEILRVQNVPRLRQLPHIPTSLEELYLEDLNSLQCLPTSFSAISSLKDLHLYTIPLLKSLPELPSSLDYLFISRLDKLQCLPSSLTAISSLKRLSLNSIPLLKSLPDLPSSLSDLYISRLKNLQCLPSTLTAISSLKDLELNSIPLLKSLPALPPSLHSLTLCKLDNLQCLPSSLSAISSLDLLSLEKIPFLKSLPDLPPSLSCLKIKELDNLQCLSSSLSAISSLDSLKLRSIPLLKSLPDLPSSLDYLSLKSLDNLQCLPSSLSAISSLRRLNLDSIPLLKSLPHLPSSLKSIRVENCHPELKRYKKFWRL